MRCRRFQTAFPDLLAHQLPNIDDGRGAGSCDIGKHAPVSSRTSKSSLRWKKKRGIRPIGDSGVRPPSSAFMGEAGALCLRAGSSLPRRCAAQRGDSRCGGDAGRARSPSVKPPASEHVQEADHQAVQQLIRVRRSSFCFRLPAPPCVSTTYGELRHLCLCPRPPDKRLGRDRLGASASSPAFVRKIGGRPRLTRILLRSPCCLNCWNVIKNWHPVDKKCSLRRPAFAIAR